MANRARRVKSIKNTGGALPPVPCPPTLYVGYTHERGFIYQRRNATSVNTRRGSNGD